MTLLDLIRRLLARPATRPVVPTTTTIVPPAYADAQLLGLHNAMRANAGLPPLALDATLTGTARAFAAELARRDVLTHTSSDGSSPWDRIYAAGYPRVAVGENAAQGQDTPAFAVQCWMESSGHRANILGWQYARVGFGYAASAKGTPYWIADFGG